MTTLKLESLPNISGEAMANFLTFVSKQQGNADGLKHKYDKWTLVSHAHTVELRRNGQLLARDDYPTGFDAYLPEPIDRGDTTYGIATFPGMNEAFKEAVKIYLAPTWDTRINTSIRNHALTGDDTQISDSRVVSSGINGWNITNVRITQLDEHNRIAYLHFASTQNGDEVVASWIWID